LAKNVKFQRRRTSNSNTTYVNRELGTDGKVSESSPDLAESAVFELKVGVRVVSAAHGFLSRHFLSPGAISDALFQQSIAPCFSLFLN
jgi:hypothetical protein